MDTVVNVSKLRENKLTGDDFWNVIHTKYGRGLLTVSRPIFNRDYTKAYIRFGYSCGGLCGGGEDMVMEKVEGKWKVLEYVSSWLS